MRIDTPWILILIPILTLYFLIWIGIQFRYRRHLKAIVSAQESPERLSPYFAAKLIRRGWLILGLCLVVLAGSRPQWGDRIMPTDIQAQAVWVVIDLSNSMRVTDVPPNRLERAKLEAIHIIQRLDNAVVGVVGYAGNAYILCPLTTDIDLVTQTISDLQIGDISQQGSSLEALIPTIIKHQSSTTNGPATLIILGDGEIRKGQTADFVKSAQSANLTAFTLAIGSESGGFIPIPNKSGGFSALRDENNQQVISKTNLSFFKTVAQETGAQWFESNAQQLASEAVVAAVMQHRQSGLIHTRHWQRPDQFAWILAPGIFCILMGLIWGKTR